MNTSDYPNERLRQKLMIAGIPESEQSMESLVAKIPSDFTSRSFQDTSPDMMAELILYFIAKGIVTLPVASDKALLDMPWGSHVCQFYNGKKELLEMLVPYFKQGLERNEACVWLVGDLTVSEARNALLVIVPDLHRHLGSGQMQIVHYASFYTDPNGAVKHSNELSAQFAAMGSTMIDKGFAGLRASGDVSWVNSDESMSRFMEYETKVNFAIQDSRIMAVCTYPAGAAAMCGCRELIHNHGKFFVKRGEWVHDMSREAQRIEAVFASLAAA